MHGHMNIVHITVCNTVIIHILVGNSPLCAQ